MNSEIDEDWVIVTADGIVASAMEGRCSKRMKHRPLLGTHFPTLSLCFDPPDDHERQLGIFGA